MKSLYIKKVLELWGFLACMALLGSGTLHAAVDDISMAIKQYKSSLPCIGEASKALCVEKIANFLLRYSPVKCAELEPLLPALMEKIKCNFVEFDKPLNMVIKGFPFKSINRKKCLSADADLGDYLALVTLNHIAEQISSVYEPGAHITIVCDGYGFKLIGDPDDHVIERYGNQIRHLIAELPLPLLTFDDSLGLAADARTADALRACVAAVELSPDEMKIAPQEHAEQCIFIEKDLASVGLSRAECKKVTTDQILGSRRFGKLAAQHYPPHKFLPLSVHRYADVTKRVSVTLLYNAGAKEQEVGTPWHHSIRLEKGWLRRAPKLAVAQCHAVEQAGLALAYVTGMTDAEEAAAWYKEYFAMRTGGDIC